MLKTDFHIHTSEDKLHKLKYSAKDIILAASKLGYTTLSITNHNACFFSSEIKEFAKKQGILLIPGIESTIEGRHVIILNYKNEVVPSKISELYKLRNENKIVIAPHLQYFFFANVGNLFFRYPDSFDAIEFSGFYVRFPNFNRNVFKIAKKYDKTVLGNSDLHTVEQLNSTYSLIDSENDVDSVLEAIRKNDVKVVSKPLSYLNMVKLLLNLGPKI